MKAPSFKQYFFNLLILTFSTTLPSLTWALKCLDCVGENCKGPYCTGDYCVVSHFAPRWGTVEWGKPLQIKGCLSGDLVRGDIRNHCEAADELGEEVFTCFCKKKDYCNGAKAVQRLEVEHVELLTCVCEGVHCKAPTCRGELCSYVVNHRTKEFEQGCVNASVPLIERRSAGACMIPPITGAMHHTVAKDADDLLVTESCVCGTDFCNKDKPETTVAEKMNCRAFVKAEVIGTKMESKTVSCTGEYCFKAKIKSKIGHMSKYETIGCATFTEGAELAEELNPVGCAKFESEKVEVESCINTNDKQAVGRARANQQGRSSPGKANKASSSKIKQKMEITYEDENDVEEEEKTGKEPADADSEKNAKETDEEEETEKEASREKSTTPHYIFQRPTLAPEVKENSNTTLVSVFLLLILLIILSGIVWKFQLHKRLFRASYDTVAGG